MTESGRDWIFRIFRFFNTLRYLLPVQIFGRLRFMLRRRLVVTKFPGEVVENAEKNIERLRTTGCEIMNFGFNNFDRPMPCNNIKWKSGDYAKSEKPEKLWLYKLNYFDWLFENKISFAASEYAILDWIIKNPDSLSETWEPYPMSRRLISWVKWLDDNKKNKNMVVSSIKSMERAIECQANRLLKDIEYHIQANHIITNIQGLLTAADYLLKEDYQSHKIIEVALDELAKQLKIQFFADGGHFERSPMYHTEMMAAIKNISEVLDSLARQRQIGDLLANRIKLMSSLCLKKLNHMAEWLEYLTHPDGKVAMFGDSAAVAGSPKFNSKAIDLFLESGFFIYRHYPIYFVMSVAPPSPSFQPGHSHCDIFSFELSLGNKRIVTDTGCGSYQDHEIREHCRRTYSHNVPQIQYHEQSEIYDFFRIGKRAKMWVKNYDSAKKTLELQMYDQHMQLYIRKVEFRENSIEIRDFITDKNMTGTFVSVLHISDEIQGFVGSRQKGVAAEFDIEGYHFTVCTDYQSRIDSHVYYKDFGEAAKGKKIIFNNGWEYNIAYVLKWEKA